MKLYLIFPLIAHLCSMIDRRGYVVPDCTQQLMRSKCQPQSIDGAESNAVNKGWHEGYGATTINSPPQVSAPNTHQGGGCVVFDTHKIVAVVCQVFVLNGWKNMTFMACKILIIIGLFWKIWIESMPKMILQCCSLSTLRESIRHYRASQWTDLKSQKLCKQ